MKQLSKNKQPRVRIMAFGTFDIVHKGHEYFFNAARKLAKNPYLIISIARDSNVKKIKGVRPENTERVRAMRVRKNVFVDKVVLGGVKNYILHIKKERPQIIALGYDQSAYTETLKKDLEQAGLAARIIRLKAYQPKKYKTSLLTKSKK